MDSTEEERSSECVGVVTNHPDFAMKIIHCSGSFNTEVNALFAIKPPYFISGISFKGDVTPGTYPLPTPNSSIPLIGNTSEGGWWTRTPRPSNGGCLLMEMGEALPDPLEHSTRHDIFNQIYRSLAHMHALRYCHTDVRLPNILKFGDKYCLIDYGEVVATGAMVDIEEFSDGRKDLVSELGPYVSWESGHDVAMLARAVYQITPGLPISITSAITPDTSFKKCQDIC